VQDPARRPAPGGAFPAEPATTRDPRMGHVAEVLSGRGGWGGGEPTAAALMCLLETRVIPAQALTQDV